MKTKMKLIVAVIDDNYSEEVLYAAQQAGAATSTVISNARGGGLGSKRSLLGLELGEHCDVLLFPVDAAKATDLLQAISKAGNLDEESGTSMAFQLDVEDAVGAVQNVAATEAASALGRVQ